MAALPAWNLLKGKTAAITGGTTGIGRAIVLAYITQGCNVAVNHLGLEKDEQHRHSLLEEVKAIKNTGVKAGEILELPGDVTNPSTSTNLVKQAVSQWGKLDIFVANAGVFKQAEFLKLVTVLSHPPLKKVICANNTYQNRTIPPRSQRRRERQRMLLFLPGRSPPDGRARPRGLHYRYFLRQCSSRRRLPDPLHTHKSRYPLYDAVHGNFPRRGQDPMQCAYAWYNCYSARRSRYEEPYQEGYA